MKEIKFRTWSETSGRMTDWKILRGLHAATFLGKQSGKLKVMQFTGLLDRNGHEIFEGDVLKSVEHDEVYKVDDITPVHRHTHVTNIGYFSGKKYYHRDNPASRYDNMDDWMSWAEMYEVIGNIYENPELLK
jgi:uncharacterized phage protein (TIGR01671 family)